MVPGIPLVVVGLVVVGLAVGCRWVLVDLMGVDRVGVDLVGSDLDLHFRQALPALFVSSYLRFDRRFRHLCGCCQRLLHRWVLLGLGALGCNSSSG